MLKRRVRPLFASLCQNFEKLTHYTLSRQRLFNLCLERACRTIIDAEGKLDLTHDDRDAIRASQKDVKTPSLGEMIDHYLRSHPRFRDMKPLEHRLFEWHCANLEYANATTLDSLSLHHWDQVIILHLNNHIRRIARLSDAVPSYQEFMEN